MLSVSLFTRFLHLIILVSISYESIMYFSRIYYVYYIFIIQKQSKYYINEKSLLTMI